MADRIPDAARWPGKWRFRPAFLGLLILTAGIGLTAGWGLWLSGRADPDRVQPAETPSAGLSQSTPATAPPRATAGLPGSASGDVSSGDAERAGSAAPADARYAEMIVGTWSNFHHGERTMTVRPDGTATMVIELTGIKASLFTPRLELEMVWSIEDGCMKRRNTGGNPPEKVEFVNLTYGDRVAERILEMTDDRMVLQDGSQDYEWRRVE